MELPYGTITPKVYYQTIKSKDSNEQESELLEVPAALQDRKDGYFSIRCTPEPVSREMQQQFDDDEEKGNKEKEREARQAQKELEQRKARQKAEAQQQLLKQEQNSAKLKVYFSAMDLYFHK